MVGEVLLQPGTREERKRNHVPQCQQREFTQAGDGDEATPHVHGLGILESAPRGVAWSQAHERAFTTHTTHHAQHVIEFHDHRTGAWHVRACVCD
jgi:hypothetical protein